MPTVFVVDDDRALLKTLHRSVTRMGYEVQVFESVDEFWSAWDARAPDVVLSDVHMPGADGFSMLNAVKRLDPEVPVILMTGAASLDSAVRALREGAYDYLVKPFVPIDVVSAALARATESRTLRTENRRLNLEVEAKRRSEEVIGATGSLKRLFSLVDSVGRLDVSVLIQGESGTGKELVARAVHAASPRSHRRMISINCGALSETLLESELFGHAKGAFTGADKARVGLFEQADRSTLFLDEVGELSMSTQVKLLRVLQEGELRPVGSNTVKRVDVRIVAATHRDLPVLVEQGLFREDLYFRLNVVGAHVPALRQRREDIPDLASYFLARQSARLGKPFTGIHPACLEALIAYRWPGNIRELENAIIRAIAVSDGPVLSVEALPPEVRGVSPSAPMPELEKAPETELAEFAEARRQFEQTYLMQLLAKGGNLSVSARIAGLDPSNLRRMLKRHGMKS